MTYDIDKRAAAGAFLVDESTGLPVSFAATTIADGADVAEGTKADAAYTTGSGTVISILKGIFGRLTQAAGDALAAAAIHATGGYGYNGTTWDRLRVWNGSGGSQGSVGGQLAVPALVDSTNNLRAQFSAAALSDATTGNNVAAVGPYLWNGTGSDRQRNNSESTVLASAARTTLTNSPDQINYNGRSLKIYINVSAYTAGGLTVKYQEKESISGTYIDVLTATKIVAVTAVPVELQIGPHVAAAANLTANRYAARTWRVVCTPDDATSITYSVSAVTGV